MADAPADTLRVTCDCGARLKVPAKAAGRRVKCPKCTAVLKVPAKEPPAPEPAPLSGGSDTGDLLEQLAAEARAAPAASGPSPAVGTPTHCPGCGAALPTGAKLCVSCGYSLSSGGTRKAARVGPGAVPSGPNRTGAGTRRLTLAVVLGGAVVIIGAVIWLVLGAVEG
jgi:hypothetical protein